MKKEVIRRNCFWYRPWRDMSATIDQCYFYSDGECPCNKDCKWYISKHTVDDLMYTILQTRVD